jgi:hypothetical protein
MCEYCNKTDVTLAQIDSEEEPPCEWFSEEEGPGSCDKPAVFKLSEWYVEDHLCETHKKETEEEMEEGLGDVLNSAGFGAQYEMRAIEQEETCDYISPADSGNWKPCGKKASHAKYILENWALCADHAVEMSRSTQKK